MDRKEPASEHDKTSPHILCEHCDRALSIDELIEKYCTSCKRYAASREKRVAV